MCWTGPNVMQEKGHFLDPVSGEFRCWTGFSHGRRSRNSDGDVMVSELFLFFQLIALFLNLDFTFQSNLLCARQNCHDTLLPVPVLTTSKKRQKHLISSLSTVTPREDLTALLGSKWSYIHSTPKSLARGMSKSNWSAWDRRFQWFTALQHYKEYRRCPSTKGQTKWLGSHTERTVCFSWADWW